MIISTLYLFNKDRGEPTQLCLPKYNTGLYCMSVNSKEKDVVMVEGIKMAYLCYAAEAIQMLWFLMFLK